MNSFNGVVDANADGGENNSHDNISDDGGSHDISHWLSIGRSHFQEELAEYTRLMELLKKYEDGNDDALHEFDRRCEQFYGDYERGVDDDPGVQLDLGPSPDEEFGRNVWLDGDDLVLCAGWQTFCCALRKLPTDYLSEMSIQCIHITNNFVYDLGSTILTAPSLKFEECTFGKHSLGNMAQCLRGNASLKSMRLINDYGDQDWDDIVEVECLADVLKDLPMLQDFSYSRNLSCHPEILSIIMEGVKDVPKVNVCFTECPSGGFRIARMLASNPKVKHVHIESDRVREINGYIKQIEISEYTKQIGADALIKAVYDSSSLNATMDCNHTSEVSFFGMSDIQEEFNGLIRANWTPAAVMKYKLLHILGAHSGLGLNLDHLNGLPLKLIPRLFNLVQSVQYPHISLSNAFHTMRDTVVPMLCSP